VRAARRRPAIVGGVFTFHPLSDGTRRRLLEGGLDPDAVAALVRMAVAEDLIGGTDVTSAATVPADQRSVGTFGSRGHGVVAGLAVAAAAIDAVCGDAASQFEYLVADGDRVTPGQDVARVAAPTRSLLTAERTSLNLLCHLSGVATLTRRWADALAGTGCVVRDTRKTTPGLRALEKYAVRCGGGANHRMGLSDAALVKDNHVMAAGGVAQAFAAVRSLGGRIPVEIEVDSLDGLRVAIGAGADAVLLDNFDLPTMRAAVALRAELGAEQVVLEASGGLSLEVADQVGRTGVDFVAVGELTHSAKVLDLGLDLDEIQADRGGG
jgi:nicotinate-nucleotide pyrophosphorylase (carboxylating)